MGYPSCEPEPSRSVPLALAPQRRNAGSRAVRYQNRAFRTGGTFIFRTGRCEIRASVARSADLRIGCRAELAVARAQHGSSARMDGSDRRSMPLPRPRAANQSQCLPGRASPYPSCLGGLIAQAWVWPLADKARQGQRLSIVGGITAAAIVAPIAQPAHEQGAQWYVRADGARRPRGVGSPTERRC
jgi:hypothetical protein